MKHFVLSLKLIGFMVLMCCGIVTLFAGSMAFITLQPLDIAIYQFAMRCGVVVGLFLGITIALLGETE